jgi:transmembrane sensor
VSDPIDDDILERYIRGQSPAAEHVAVASGRVALRPAAHDSARPPAGPERILPALVGGDVPQLDADGRATLEHGVDVTPYLAWTDGTLVFIATPLRELIPQLERWYDLDITLADPALAAKRVTVTFDDQAASRALQLLGIIADLRIEQHGRAVVLHLKDHGHPPPPPQS